MKTVVNSTLRCATHSASNRHRARELVWRWIGAKWPQLMPNPHETAHARVERALPGQELMASFDATGHKWSLSIAHQQRNSPRVWMATAQICDTGSSDMLHLQAACTDAQDTLLNIVPPRLLGDWVESLHLDDAGLTVQGEPREVSDDAHLDGLFQHLLSPARTLPVIALVNKPNSRFYGVDPKGLAQAVRGLAHVACVSADMAPALSAQLGSELAVAQSAARIFAPGLVCGADSTLHPLIRDKTKRGQVVSVDPGGFRKLLTQKICALSVTRA